MQVQIGQVKHRFQKEYGTDVDQFLESIYQAGMDINPEWKQSTVPTNF